jgi:glycosyltransferase involved in cell wall biosynthesis
MKKFLIISSYAPPAISGSPLMMYELLRHFPADSFAILTSPTGMDAKNDSHRLPVPYYYYTKAALSIADQQAKGALYKLKRLLKQNPLTKLFGELFFLLYIPWRIVYVAKAVLKKEQPELILAYSDPGQALLATYIIHRLTGIPYYIYFYDLYAGNRLPWLHQKLAQFLEPRLVQRASKIFAMAEGLKSHYQQTYDVPVEVVRIAVPASEASNLPALHEPYKIIYTGTIYWAQADAVRNLIAAVQQIDRPHVELWLYTPHDAAYLKNFGIFASSKVHFATGSRSEMPSIQKQASILAVLLGFETDFPTLINTSSPGKTYEYMTSNRPILIHAPKDAFISKYALENQFAYVVNEPNVVQLKAAISALLTDNALRDNLVANAKATYQKNHDSAKVAEQFKQYFE